MAVRIRVVTWNVDSRPTGLLDVKVDLLRRLKPDLALLQEIGRPVYRALMPHPSAHERMHRKTRHFAWGALSTDLCNPRASEFRLGCAILGGPTTALIDSGVLDGAPFDVREPVRPGFLWRTVMAQAALSTGDILTVCSFHGRQPTGVPAASLQRAFHAQFHAINAVARGNEERFQIAFAKCAVRCVLPFEERALQRALARRGDRRPG